MKNEIVKAKHVKPIKEKLWKFYLQVFTDGCVKIAVLEICSEKNNRESVVGTVKNICIVAVHCWYLEDTFAEFCQQIFKKKSEGILGKIDKKTLLCLEDFGC